MSLPLRALLALSTGAAVLPLVIAAAPAAADVGPVHLPVDGVVDVTLAEVAGRVFLPTGADGEGVLVTDLEGRLVTTLDLPGATGSTVTPDGGSVWVARRGELDRIDPRSLAVVQRVTLPSEQCTGDVAVVGRRLVYGYACAPLGAGIHDTGVAVVDAVTGTLVGHTSFHSSQFPPLVASGRTGQVYVGHTGVTPTTLSVYDVRGAGPRLVTTRLDECGSFEDLSARPDGAVVVTACAGAEQHEAFSAKGLAAAGSYPSSAFPSAGAWSADGSTFVAGSTSWDDEDVRVYTAGGTVPTRTLDLGPDEIMLSRGLAVSTDGRRVWAATASWTGRGYVFGLRVLEADGPAASSLSWSTSQHTAYAGYPFQAEGVLTHEGAGIAGVPLTVTARQSGGDPVELPAVTTSADGSFRFTATPPAAGSWHLTVSWAGDGARPAVSATVSVSVLTVLTTVELDVTVTRSGEIAGTVRLRSDDPALVTGRRVAVEAVRQDGASTTVGDLVTDASGTATFTYAPGVGTHTITAILSGELLEESRSTRTVTVSSVTPRR